MPDHWSVAHLDVLGALDRDSALLELDEQVLAGLVDALLHRHRIGAGCDHLHMPCSPVSYQSFGQT